MCHERSQLTEAKVDWREALREFVTSFCMDKDESTWRRPSRRWIDQEVYMPSVVGESVGRIVLGIDMSGSIGAEEIGQFLGEVERFARRSSPRVSTCCIGTHECASMRSMTKTNWTTCCPARNPEAVVGLTRSASLTTCSSTRLRLSVQSS
jgi:predicted metal-dependent peptidase